MLNGKGFARNRSSSNQAIARFVRIYLFTFLYLTIFYFIFSLFSLALQFLVPFFFFFFQLVAQFPSSSLTCQNHPHCCLPPHSFRHPHHQYNTYAAYRFFPPRILFLDFFILKKEALRSFETSVNYLPKDMA
jgi:hypothetical protein